MPDLPSAPTPVAPRRPFVVRALGIVLLVGSVGLVSCQALFHL